MKLGLIGFPLEHSFSRQYFEKKFAKEGINEYEYVLFPIKKIEEIEEIISENQDLIGFNITIPYKEAIIPYLDELHPTAESIGAVNTVKITRAKEKTSLAGYNTDAYGFGRSILPHLSDTERKALILGSGGASKAVQHVLRNLHIDFTLVSRYTEGGQLSYSDLSAEILDKHRLIVNATPVGTYPNASECPDLPYEHLTSGHFLFDLIYNPDETEFLKRGKARGASTLNGLEMLCLQAEEAWRIWVPNEAD